ncbi:hypothetical protein Ancab_029299 [Ancistrocladus abbreviatus]
MQVNNKHELLLAMKKIWVGTYKLIVELARDRGQEKNPYKPMMGLGKSKAVMQGQSKNFEVGNTLEREQRMSYEDVVRKEFLTQGEITTFSRIYEET